MWLIQVYSVLLTSYSVGIWFVLSHSASRFWIPYPYNYPRSMTFVVRYVSDSYVSTALTFDLNIRSVVGVDIYVNFS